MLLLALDAEIRLRFAGSVQLGADAGVVRHQRAVGEVRPVAADRLVELRGPRRVDRVVDAVYPLHVGSEAYASPEIQRGVDSQSRGVRHGIDEMPEWRTCGHREVVAARQVQPGDAFTRVPFDAVQQIDGAQPGAVDHEAGFDLRGAVAGGL